MIYVKKLNYKWFLMKQKSRRNVPTTIKIKFGYQKYYTFPTKDEIFLFTRMNFYQLIIITHYISSHLKKIRK